MRENSNRAKAPQKKTAEVIRGKIRNIALRLQATWADWLARKTAKMSRRSLYISLGLFVAAGTTYNSLVLTGHLGYAEIRPGRIQVPSSSTQFRIPKNLNPLDQGAKDLNNAQAYLDSLKSTSLGQVMIDSILKVRPGLFDSINTAKEMMRKH